MEQKQLELVQKDEPKSELTRFVEMTKDLDVDKLEKFIALRTQEEERNSRKDFDFHFVEMQKEYKSAYRTKDVKNRDGTKVLYKFCPLENILTVYAPVISAHGFSFRWSEEAIEGGKRVWCIVSGYGHTERSSVDIPIQAGNDFTNAIQQRGISTSYGKRYSFINAFGVIIEGEDEDAHITVDEFAEYREVLNPIFDAKNADELLKAGQKVKESIKEDDSRGKAILTKAYAKKKEELKVGK